MVRGGPGELSRPGSDRRDPRAGRFQPRPRLLARLGPSPSYSRQGARRGLRRPARSPRLHPGRGARQRLGRWGLRQHPLQQRGGLRQPLSKRRHRVRLRRQFGRLDRRLQHTQLRKRVVHDWCGRLRPLPRKRGGAARVHLARVPRTTGLGVGRNLRWLHIQQRRGLLPDRNRYCGADISNDNLGCGTNGARMDVSTLAEDNARDAPEAPS